MLKEERIWETYTYMRDNLKWISKNCFFRIWVSFIWIRCQKAECFEHGKKICGLKKGETFLTSWETASVSKRTLTRGVNRLIDNCKRYSTMRHNRTVSYGTLWGVLQTSEQGALSLRGNFYIRRLPEKWGGSISGSLPVASPCTPERRIDHLDTFITSCKHKMARQIPFGHTSQLSLL
jgi:hypothetical protein